MEARRLRVLFRDAVSSKRPVTVFNRSNHLGSYTKADGNGKFRTKSEVIVNEINFFAHYGRGSTCQKSEQSEVGGETTSEIHNKHPHLWQEFSTNPYELHNCIKSKVNLSYPDFKNNDTGKGLSLRSNIGIASFVELESHYDLLLHSCNSLTTLKQIHSSLTTFGFIRQSPHLGAQIIIKYSMFRYPESARFLFDDIHHGPNSFLWNTMLRAYANGGHFTQTLDFYSLMRRTGIEPNNYTFPFILKACASKLLSVQGKLVHCDVIRTGFDFDMYVEASLVDMYAKCGLIDDGRRVFDGMSERDLICWTAMITAYEQAEQAKDSLILLDKMQQEGLSMDSVTAVTVASAVGQLGDAKKAYSVHAYVICNAFLGDVCVGNSIVAMYAKCGDAKNARMVFDRMEERDGISWNSMLSCYTQNGLASEALLLFDQMQASGSKPNPVTALIMVSACSYLGSSQLGRKLHNFIINNDIRIDTTLWNAIMDMYAKCGDLDTTVEIFNRMCSNERDVSSWNVLISGYGMHGHGQKALELFSQMQEEGVQPNHITFTSILSACSHAGLINEGWECFSAMAKFSVIPEAKHYACMVDMLGRAGLLHEAYDLIKKMPSQPTDGVWGALLLACRIHRNTELGEIAANNLFQLEPEHAGYYVLMSNIYAVSSKWQEVGKLRQDMKRRGLKKPAAFSVIEFGKEVHGFHTADQLNPYSREVYRKVESLAIEMKMAGYVPDRSCILHDVEEEDKEHILNFHSEKLAVAFGLMKIETGLAIHVTKNLRVCNDCHSAFKFISKIYERKIIIRDANRFHHFQSGSCSCKDYW
ncbi:pentatricopeptide repeat-containing protein At3g26782, mitochondrial-like [Cornus florida]|uniref:pentatricopeptide repeat-containing protein At3g26782, mitochondrial-like n=1 Tax=Cornus florida TaxID=4283 RepID=UPI00289EDD58|nr:pentatricopeptide repeat-containing protein At3g26782, mitochondrial-like [Cornus florida]XP_059634018.1 pentatricopeptide repeat-containing protein At3g26782, mitochondrial-like [Cornus florida]XP_059634019.1 pentatricopeptide repeat-containing protein At3g26782, mitochondrial-like [Cornus florida]XP_059634020.1 pentatricopeptide repeat-containing protein At3g26782, mitochondrial-like [Cornus florida]XP_059634021.1 pentatricopeptide repeat-containing protein At3g26782, mitochondrial-like [C